YIILLVIVFFFFFSSRRRHTRCLSDWSSDVCSSDLITKVFKTTGTSSRAASPQARAVRACTSCLKNFRDSARLRAVGVKKMGGEIGRASCREREEGRVEGRAVERKRERMRITISVK